MQASSQVPAWIAAAMSDAKVQIYGMVHSQNVLGPLMIATHYKLGELAFTNLFEDRTPEFKAMNPFNKASRHARLEQLA